MTRAPDSFRSFALAVFPLALGLVACSSDSRNEPSPRETCRQLAEECAGLDFGRSSDCAELGEQGLKDPQYEDQCFVFYDGCIDECRWIKLWDRSQGTDTGEGGVDEPAPEEAGTSDAASEPDASFDAGLAADSGTAG